MKFGAGCCLVAAALLAQEGDASNLLRHASPEGTTLPPMPWIGKHMLKAADQHVNVAEMAAASSKASEQALLAEQEKLNADTASEQASDVVATAPASTAIKQALDQAEVWSKEAASYAKHAEETRAALMKLPEEAVKNVTKAIELEVQKEAYAAAESKAAEPVETEEARKRRAGEALAAAAEPYHLAILKAQKNVQVSLAKSKQAADKVNQLAAESQEMGKEAVRLQEKGETLLAQQLLLEAHQKMQKSTEMKYWVGKFYKDASDWNDSIGTYQQHQQMAISTASATFVEKAGRELPPMPPMPAA